MPIGALIAGGVSLISGLLGRQSAARQAKKEEDAIRAANQVATDNANRMNREARARADAAALVPVATSHENITTTQGGVDMDAFMNAAEKYGFNPLTFLRSGALSLFANNVTTQDDWTCTTGEHAMDAAVQGQYIPQLAPVISQTKVPGIGDVLGGALTSGANQYLSDLSTAQNNAFQLALQAKQLQGINGAGSYNGGRSFSIPQAFLSGSPVVRGGGSTAINASYTDGNGNKVTGPSGDLPDPEMWLSRWLLEHASDAPSNAPNSSSLNDRTPYDTWMRVRNWTVGDGPGGMANDDYGGAMPW